MRPKWKSVAQELWVGNKLVKRFKRPADSAGALLEAFELADWEHAVENPFKGEHDAKSRLHDAIKNLNKCQKVIRFRGNGDGMGATWEWR
jgi:hypothetical protein